jgi:hypothetical protein
MARNAKQSFVRHVGEKLPAPHVFRKATQAFYWDCTTHTDIFGVRVLDRSRKVELSFGVSFPAVEKIFHSAWPIEPEFRIGSYTIAAAAEDLDPALPVIYAPIQPEDFDSVSSDVIRVFESHRSYYREYCAMSAVDRLLNDEPDKKSVHCPLPYRGAIGIIVGALVGRRDLPSLVAQHRAELAKVHRGFYLPNFDRVVDALQQPNATAPN